MKIRQLAPRILLIALFALGLFFLFNAPPNAVLVHQSAYADQPHSTQNIVAQSADQLGAHGIPAYAIAIQRGPEAPVLAAFGDNDGQAVTPHTPFLLGSTSKTLTAAVVMKLVEEGRIRLDDPVIRFLPDFLGGDRRAARVTVRMLLNQNSGISHRAGDQPVRGAGVRGDQAIQQWVRRLGPDSLDRDPGTRFDYSNANYIVLGAVAEKASGLPFRILMKQKLFSPLGMSDATAGGQEKCQGHAGGHRQWFDGFESNELPQPDSFVPAGFICASISDLSNFLAMIRNGGSVGGQPYLEAHHVRALLSSGVSVGEGAAQNYAMGWVSETFNGVPVYYHDGDTGRTSSILVYAEKQDTVIAIVANASGWALGPALTDTANTALSHLTGRAPKSYRTVYILLRAALVAALALVVAQAWLVATHAGRSLVAMILTAAYSVAVIMILAWIIPSKLLGIAMDEYVLSIPVLGLSAMMSLALGCVLAVKIMGRAWSGIAARPSKSGDQGR